MELQTLREMLHDRGYTEIEEKKSGSWLCKKAEEASPLPIYVHFVRGEKVGIEHVRSWKETLSKYAAVIIVHDDIITPSAKTAVVSSKLQFFHISELVINVTKHKLVPRHELMSEVEVEALLKQYRCQKDQLPRIPMKDPVIKYYGYQPGQVVRVKRNFGVQIGSYDYPRVVVKNV